MTKQFSSCSFKILFLPLALTRNVALGSAMLFLTCAAVHLLTIVAIPVSADPSRPPSAVIPSTGSTISDAINQNTTGRSEGYALGVPRSYGWYRGLYKPPGYSAPPSQFTAVTGWGQVYPKVGAPRYSNPDGHVLIANARTYVHLSATGEWVLVQNQATDRMAGAHFAADFGKKPTTQMKISSLSDGSVAVGIPPAGQNDHFWLTNRGTYSAGSVDGVYVQMDIKTNDPDLKLVANVGADWWRDATAAYVHGFENNPGAGMSNWVELSTTWTRLHFYSWSNSKLRSNPPPPLADAALERKPAAFRSRASTSIP
jgi:hypothetical protein